MVAGSTPVLTSYNVKMKNLTIKYLLDKTNKLSPINDGNEIRFKDKNGKTWMMFSKNLSKLNIRYHSFYKTLEVKFGISKENLNDPENHKIYLQQTEELENIIKEVLNSKYSDIVIRIAGPGLL